MRSWRAPGYAQSADDPAVCISWNDARAYVAWLAVRTGENYRLLSEAEWEYAARAGSGAARFWGDDSALACDFANVYDRTGKNEVGITWNPHACDDGAARTAPVGGYRANGFGLHDMLGNVWEWTADCWADDDAGASSEGGAGTHGPCSRRVVRGGSWYYGPWFVRSAERTGVDVETRIFDVGIRVARDLD